MGKVIEVEGDRCLEDKHGVTYPLSVMEEIKVGALKNSCWLKNGARQKNLLLFERSQEKAVLRSRGASAKAARLFPWLISRKKLLLRNCDNMV